MLLLSPLAAPLAQQPPPGEAVSAAYDEAARMILCDCGCHPQSAHECACGRAAEMREEIQAILSKP